MERSEVMKILNKSLEIGRGVIANGNVATYIPELSKADKNKLGICLYTVNGEYYKAGDWEDRFTIQSISKLISLCLALEHFGPDKVFEKVGMEPSGEAFNSLIELDLRYNRPLNPMINSGAITIASMLVPYYSFYDLQNFAHKLCSDSEIEVDDIVYQSEMSTCSRNRAIAYLLESKGIIEANVEDSLKFYTRLCSMKVNACSLAHFGMLLANDGVVPGSGERLISSKTAQIVKTIMLTCGMYDASGEFAVRVGIPTKSGVGGGLVSVADRKMGIGVYGPSLDEKGNCIAGCELLKYISRKLELHIFQNTEWEE